ncbi:MAG: hypothetical protein VSS75_009755 [Candidatus Parabeggiatoa sp.]|nr:hypothetical protein [Candidatus Parabeggiatoa sp.]
MKGKTFSCVALQHRGAEKIYEQTKHLTISEEVAYWQRRSNELRQAQEARKASNPNLVVGVFENSN